MTDTGCDCVARHIHQKKSGGQQHVHIQGSRGGNIVDHWGGDGPGAQAEPCLIQGAVS